MTGMEVFTLGFFLFGVSCIIFPILFRGVVNE